jgi:hypothetical protein
VIRWVYRSDSIKQTKFTNMIPAMENKWRKTLIYHYLSMIIQNQYLPEILMNILRRNTKMKRRQLQWQIPIFKYRKEDNNQMSPNLLATLGNEFPPQSSINMVEGSRVQRRFPCVKKLAHRFTLFNYLLNQGELLKNLEVPRKKV